MHIVPSMSKQYVIDDDSVKVGSNLKYEISFFISSQKISQESLLRFSPRRFLEY